MSSSNEITKRIFDIVFGFLGILLLAPLILVVAILIKRDTPGPVFYKGLRAGRKHRNFYILKFRTMHDTPDSDAGPKITAIDDPRVTRLGRWLRDTKLNELPQLWNVLVGEMSIVGPRPEHPEVVVQWPDSVREEILSVRPGITSPASVLYRDEETRLRFGSVMKTYFAEILPSKMRLDQLYVRNHSVLADLDVIFWTLVVLFPPAREKKISEHRLFCGPLSVFVSRFLNWFMIDIFVAFMAVVAAALIWRESGPLNLGIGLAFSIAAGTALVFSVINFLLGLDRVVWSRASATDALDLVFPSGLVTAILVTVDEFLLTTPLLPRGLLLVIGLLAFLGFVGVRYRSRIITGLASRWLRVLRRAESMGERVLIVGADNGGQLGAMLLRKAGFGEVFSIVGMVDDNPRLQGMRVDGCTVIGTTEDIPSLVKQHDIGHLLYAIHPVPPEDKQRILSYCAATQIRFTSLPEIMHTLHPDLSGNNGLSNSNQKFTAAAPYQFSATRKPAGR